MKILVTGGAGFIGLHLLELLNSDKNYEVVVLDNLSSGFRENVPQGMRLVVADIRSQEIEALFQKENFDAVVHLAAQTMVPYSIEHPDEDCEINLAGLINVLENCRKYKVKTVLFASSAAVYGNNENVPLHEDLALMGNQTINVSTEHETSVNQLLGAFAEVDADKLEVRYAEMRQGDIFRSALSNARLKEILAVTPQMQLKEGIQKTYHDYVKRGK